MRPVPGHRPAERERPRARRVRVLIADRQLSFVEALTLRLEDELGLHVVAGATSADEVVKAVRTGAVDVALLAVDGADDFLARADELLDANPELGLVAVAEQEDVDLLARAVRLGFRGWVCQDAGVEELVDVVRGVGRGETRIPALLLSRLLPRLLDGQGRQPADGQPFDALTGRERQVLTAMMRGSGRDQIAAELSISPNTARTHMQNLLGKLGVHSAVAAVALARRAGIR